MDTTIIIPSACRTERKDCILKAINSVIDSAYCNPRVVFVANGPNVDTELLAYIAKLDRVETKYLKTPSAPNAVMYGVENCVHTKYFGFLDDDDYFLPNAISNRQVALEAQPLYDVAIGQALRSTQGNLSRHMSDKQIESCGRDPFEVIFRQKINWMTSSAGLYRASSIGVSYFKENISYFEWTYLAAKMLTSGVNFLFLNEPDHIILDDDAEGKSLSLSKTQKYAQYESAFMRAIKELPLNKEQRKMVAAKEADHFHDLAEKMRKSGRGKEALVHHLRSLRSPQGFMRYVLSTRHFVM
ncbi:glycosyltransferase [Alteromonas mediterranea]|nr:glycosyltransferase [Alteromonas mediterranea]